MSSDSEWNDLIEKLDYVKFEQLCRDLIVAMEYSDVIWRQGGGDSGRDIEATLKRKHPDGITHSTEKWFFECKKYSSGISVRDIDDKINWANAERADYLAFMSNSYLTNPCREYCKKEMETKRLKILEWTDLKFRDILFGFPDLCDYYFDKIPPRNNWKKPFVNEEIKTKIGDIEFGNVSQEKAIEMVENAYKIIQKMKLSDDVNEKVELFDIEKDIINFTNEKESDFSHHFKMDVPNPDFYFELALANYYMGNDEKSKEYFKKFLDQIDKLKFFMENEMGKEFNLDFDFLKTLFNIRNKILHIENEFGSPTSIYNLAQKSDNNTIEVTSIFQWFDWDGESITCLDLNGSPFPCEIFTSEKINEKLKERIFKATIVYISINDFQAHIKLKKIHEIL